MISALPKELVYSLEWTLLEYPKKADELDLIDEYIEKCCRASSWGGDVFGFSQCSSSIEERILEVKERDTRRQWLVGFLARVDTALSKLDENEITFVNCYYWESIPMDDVALILSISSRSSYRMKDKILTKLSKILLPGFLYNILALD